MKRTVIALSAFFAVSLYACQKNNDAASQISLTASTTQAKVGETVSVSLASSANASSWSVTPASTATKTYDLTTSKVNYFTFSEAGTYTVSVRTKKLNFDSTSGQSLNAAWSKAQGACTKGVDTASVAITVTGK